MLADSSSLIGHYHSHFNMLLCHLQVMHFILVFYNFIIAVGCIQWVSTMYLLLAIVIVIKRKW